MEPQDYGAPELQAAVETALDRAKWPQNWDTQEAVEMFFHVRIAFLANLPYPPSTEEFELEWLRQCPQRRRLRCLEDLVLFAEGLPDVPAGQLLAPLLFHEADGSILGMAGTYFIALALPDEEHGITVGGEMLLQAVGDRLAGDDVVGAGRLARGLVITGDKRFLPLMHRAWEMLPLEGRHEMLLADGGFANDGHIQFLLERLARETDVSLYGGLAGSLGRRAIIARQTSVQSIERLIPVSANPDEPIKLLETWSREEYGQRILPQLRALEGVEPESPGDPQLMPLVIAEWT